MKFNVHGGHNKKVPGASSYLNEVTEDRKIKNEVISQLKEQGHTAYDCTDDDGNTQSKNLSNIVSKCNKHDVDYDVSIHFNASKKDTGDGKTKGVEVFIYSSSSDAKKAAERVCKNIAALGFTNRGVKTSTSLYVLKHTKSPAMLIEVCFVDDKDDYNLYKKVGVEKISKAIVEGILNKSTSSSSGSESSSSGLQATSLKNLGVNDIIKKVGSLFTADQKKSGILASVSLAQFILESDYGRSELAQKANNCFGMKKSLSGNTWSGSVWDGKSVYKKETKEYVNGKYVTVTAEFRKYPSIEKSIADHSAYLNGAMNGSKKRYAGLKGEANYKKAVKIIKNGGYATSPDYVSKLCNLIEKYNITKYDVKSSSSGSSTSTETSYAKILKDWITRLQKECNRQKFSNQKVDGIAGKNTLAGCPTCRKGAKGGITKLIQERLEYLGFSCGDCGIDGDFGEDTEKAVKKFQKSKGLDDDGIVGEKTWRKLLEM